MTKQWADKVESTKIGKKSEKYEKCIDTRAFVGEKSRRMQMRRKNLERRQQREIEEKLRYEGFTDEEANYGVTHAY